MASAQGFFGVPLWVWAVFGGAVLLLLFVDLFFHGQRKEPTAKSALIWSIVWVGAGLLFNVFVWLKFGRQAAEQYLAAYLLEKSLSLDNLFVFLLVFESLKIPPNSQRSVLLWGILGAVIFRGIFIFLGVAMVEKWDWTSYLFGAILLYAAYHALREDPLEKKSSPMVEWLSKHLPVTKKTDKGFVHRERRGLVVTPLLIALIAIELIDVMFAIDSVAAALAMTRNRFLLYTSNIFAILGLRALYVLIAKTIARLRFLHYGLAAVLAFAAVKMVIQEWFEIPPLVSVGVIAVIIGAAAWVSLKGK